MPNSSAPAEFERSSGAQSGAPASETIALLRGRVSIRKFDDAPVPDALVDTVLEAAFRAPTSSNIQSYSVVVVRDAESRARLSAVTGNQAHVAATPVFLAFCADLTRIAHALEKHGHSIADNNLEIGLVSSIDATLVGMSAYLAAESVGLKGVMIGGVRNDPQAVAEILGLPHRVYCVFGMCLGWPAGAPPQKPRMAFGAMVHRERYDGAGMAAALDDYDAALATHYQAVGKATTADSWTHDVDAKFQPPPREGLRQALKARGFDFR